MLYSKKHDENRHDPGKEFATDADISHDFAEFLRRSREALTIGSDRVRAKYGFGCAGAMAQLELIEAKAGELSKSTRGDGSHVVIEGFDR